MGGAPVTLSSAPERGDQGAQLCLHPFGAVKLRKALQGSLHGGLWAPCLLELTF